MEHAQTRISTKSIATCALCVALLVVSCFFTIPVGPIPFTLQTAVVILIALLMTPKQAAVTTGVYLLMGAAGLPVFSGMTGGIIRASSGFLFSYLIGTVIASAVRLQLEKRGVRQIVCGGCLGVAVDDVLHADRPACRLPHGRCSLHRDRLLQGSCGDRRRHSRAKGAQNRVESCL